MKLLDRYIGRTVLVHTLVVMLVLLALYFFSSLVAEMDYVGHGHYTMLVAIEYCLMLVPRQIYELFPMVALLGGLLGLGTLASSNELTVIRAAGVSVRRLTWSVMKTALVLLVLVAAVGELMAPALEQEARVIRARALFNNVSLNIREGVWARDGNTFINIQHLLPGGLARGVALYVFDDQHRLLQEVRAAQARYQDKTWVLKSAVQSTIGPQGVTTAHLAEKRWQTDLRPDVLSVAALPPDKLSVWELAGYVFYTRANGLDASVYEEAMWARIVAPLATAGMMLLAVPFIFGSLRSVGVGLRITIGGLLGAGFYMYNGLFGRIALVYNLSPVVSAILPTVMVFALYWVMMRRVQ